FVAGQTIQEALPAARRLNAKGLHVSLDMLGEYVRDLDVAAAARDAYINLVHVIAERRATDGLDANISIKLSMMGQKIDEAFCLDNLRQLLEVAKAKDVFIRLDMEGSDIT